MGVNTYEWGDDDADNQGDNVGPDRKGDILLGNDDYAEDETEDEHETVPIPWGLFVVLDHVCVMSVIVLAFRGADICSLDVATPEEDAMSDECTNLDTSVENRS